MKPLPTPLIDPLRIEERVRETSQILAQEYRHRDLVLVMILKGSLCLVADLIRCLTIPFELQTLQCSSYGVKGAERGPLEIFGLERLQIRHRDVLVVDDIFDSGHTLQGVLQALESHSPRSLKSLVLLSRSRSFSGKMRPDWSLFTIGDEFVVGYGLDYKELYRGLNGIFTLQS